MPDYPPGINRAIDFIGRRVVTLRDLKNAKGQYPKGTAFIVESIWRGRLALKCDRDADGAVGRITHVPLSAVKLLPKP